MPLLSAMLAETGLGLGLVGLASWWTQTRLRTEIDTCEPTAARNGAGPMFTAPCLCSPSPVGACSARACYPTPRSRGFNQPAHGIAHSLSAELQAPLTQHTAHAENTDDVDEFLHRVAEREGYGCTPQRAREHTQARWAP
ncbi:MAG: hypothetical protein ACRDRL_10965 [Sciscionella sp.]